MCGSINPWGFLPVRLQVLILINNISWLQMAFAAVAHIYIYPATPYQHVSKQQNFNKVGSVADELEEDIEVAATSVKESIQDVVLGGGGHVS